MIRVLSAALLVVGLTFGAAQACDGCKAHAKADKAEMKNAAAKACGGCQGGVKGAAMKEGSACAHGAKAASHVSIPENVVVANVVSEKGAPLVVKEPICGMTVNVTENTSWADHDGKRYFFCNTGCKDKFTADPAKFTAAIDGKEKVVPAAHSTH